MLRRCLTEHPPHLLEQQFALAVAGGPAPDAFEPALDAGERAEMTFAVRSPVEQQRREVVHRLRARDHVLGGAQVGGRSEWRCHAVTRKSKRQAAIVYAALVWQPTSPQWWTLLIVALLI